MSAEIIGRQNDDRHCRPTLSSDNVALCGAALTSADRKLKVVSFRGWRHLLLWLPTALCFRDHFWSQPHNAEAVRCRLILTWFLYIRLFDCIHRNFGS